MMPQMLLRFAARQSACEYRYLAGIGILNEGIFKLLLMYHCVKKKGCQHPVMTVHSLN